MLAAPVLQNIAALAPARRRTSGRALVTDVGSTKRTIIDAARRAARPDLQFIGGHPLAGAAAGGVEAARAGPVRRTSVAADAGDRRASDAALTA